MSLKDDVITKAYSYRGIQEGGPEHRAIIESYNSHKPLARGYAVKLSDAWCMVFISDLFIECGAVPALGTTECGCEEYLQAAKARGMCVSAPIRGDLILYDWDGSGRASHVGLVVSVDKDGYMEVIEGNKSDSVGVRQLNYRCPYIRAIVRPRYDETTGKQPAPFDRSRVQYAQSYNAKLDGKYTVTASDFLALRYGPRVADNNLITQILPGEVVRCYGYYTEDWLLVAYGSMTGFVNKMHLKKG